MATGAAIASGTGVKAGVGAGAATGAGCRSAGVHPHPSLQINGFALKSQSLMQPVLHLHEHDP